MIEGCAFAAVALCFLFTVSQAHPSCWANVWRLHDSAETTPSSLADIKTYFEHLENTFGQESPFRQTSCTNSQFAVSDGNTFTNKMREIHKQFYCPAHLVLSNNLSTFRLLYSSVTLPELLADDCKGVSIALSRLHVLSVDKRYLDAFQLLHMIWKEVEDPGLKGRILVRMLNMLDHIQFRNYVHQAQQWSDVLITSNPSLSYPYYIKARIAMLDNNFYRAEVLFKEGMMKQQLVCYYVPYAQVLSKLGKHQLSLELLLQGEQRNPMDNNIKLALAYQYLEMEQYERGLSMAQLLYKSDPKDDSFSLVMGVAFYRLNQCRKALNHLEPIALSPLADALQSSTQLPYHLYIVQCHYQLHNYDKVVELAERTSVLGTLQNETVYELTRLKCASMLYSSLLRDSKKCFKRALKLYPLNIHFILGMGMAELLGKNPSRARLLFKNIEKIDVTTAANEEVKSLSQVYEKFAAILERLSEKQGLKEYSHQFEDLVHQAQLDNPKPMYWQKIAMSLHQLLNNPFSSVVLERDDEESTFSAGETYKLRGLFFEALGKRDLAMDSFVKASQFQPYNLPLKKIIHDLQHRKVTQAKESKLQVRDEL